MDETAGDDNMYCQRFKQKHDVIFPHIPHIYILYTFTLERRALHV